MPLYEYSCQDCDQKFEKLIRSGNRDQEAVCPSCGSTRTKRAISLFATCSMKSMAGGDVEASCPLGAGG